MDTSKEYIEMCRKAVEIQKMGLWDRVINPKDFIVRDGKVADASLRLTWLPRQDQRIIKRNMCRGIDG